VDLSTTEGVDQLIDLIGGRQVDALMANAGRGLGHGFLDQDWSEARFVIDTNITGTVYLIQKVARDMRERDRGKILITGSIAGLMPGSFQAVYNGTKAFLDSFAWALRNELKDTGVSVSCLMPGATDTEFFERADMLDTKVGADPKKADPGRCRQGRLSRHAEGRGRRRGRLQEQAAGGDGGRDAAKRRWPNSTARWPSRARVNARP
jgi:short-subunit dehydrogenase